MSQASVTVLRTYPIATFPFRLSYRWQCVARELYFRSRQDAEDVAANLRKSPNVDRLRIEDRTAPQEAMK